jgi:hypothetical protein
MLVSIALVLALAGRAPAQPPVPFTFESRAVTGAQVEVRSGPSPSPLYYSTGVLKAGDTVQVVTNKKDVPPGWVAVKPPPGSFSWVEARNVTLQDSHTGIVHVNDTSVLVGSRMDNRPPNVKSAVLVSGSLVAILDKPLVTSDGNRWLPIEPYQTEVRYIPEDAIRPAAAVRAVAAKPAAPPAVGLAPPVTGPDPLWSQAQNAEAEGRIADAESLYQRLAAQTTDRALQERCYAQLTGLQQRANASARNTTTASWTGPGQTGSASPVTTSTVYRPAPTTATGGYGPTPATPAPQSERYSGWGYLFKAGFQIDGKQAYRLTSTQNQHVCYIIAQPGFNLESYVNRFVNLYGTPGYCSETVRATFIAARYAYTQPPQ